MVNKQDRELHLQSICMIKLVFGSKNKIVKHDKRSFEQLRETIKANFPDVPADYSLSYLDQDKDQICLNSDEDLLNMFNAKLKTYKVYIKQSLSQTINLEIDNSQSFEPSFDNSMSREIEKEEEVKVSIDISQNAFKRQVKRQEQVKIEEKFLPNQQIHKQEIKQVVVQPEIVDLKQKINSQIKKQIKTDEQMVKKEEAIIISQVKQFKENISSEKEPKIEQKIPLQPQKFRDVVIQRTEVSEVIEIQAVKPQFQKSYRKLQPQRLQIAPQNRTVSRIKIAKQEQPLPIFQDEFKQEKPIKKSKKDYFDRLLEKQQSVAHKENQIPPEVHGIICSKCHDDFGIVGIRYQCILCFNYNLCSNCQAIQDHEHSLLKVKLAKKAISRDFLIEHLRKELKIMMDESPRVLPPGYYVPSINKQESMKIIEAAREAYENGIVRSQKMMTDLFYKLEMSHKNPYILKKPIEEKIQSTQSKAKYLSELVGITYPQAQRFCSKFPFYNRQQIAEEYFKKSG